MIINKALMALVVSAPLAAQTAVSATGKCTVAPGAAFGISGYNCASCGYRYDLGKRPEFTFRAEPVVTGLRSRDQNGVELGDVIEAVDGNPIVTRAGSEAFTYPAAGEHTLTVRHGHDRRELRVHTVSDCAGSAWNPGDDGIHAGSGSGSGASSHSAAAASSSGSGTSSGAGRGVGVPAIGGRPIVVVDGLARDGDAPAVVGRFGFRVECRPSCSLQRNPAGRYYYKYDGYPVIAEIRPNSAADKARLKLGDEIVKISGRSILDEVGAQLAAEPGNELHMTVRRDGKEIDVLMVVSGGE